MSEKVKVTLSRPHTTRDDKNHREGTTLSLSPLEARYVIHIGHGRPADATEATPANTTEEEQADG